MIDRAVHGLCNEAHALAGSHYFSTIDRRIIPSTTRADRRSATGSLKRIDEFPAWIDDHASG
jgi:hypothetical protein